MRERAQELGKRGRPKKGEEKGDDITLKRGSTGRAYILARLDRDDQAGNAENVTSLKRSEMNTKAHTLARLDRDFPLR